MKIPPNYAVTPEMLTLLSRIDAQRIYLLSLKLPQETTSKIQRVSLLRSSLFSARIEGNPLDLSDLASKRREDAKREVFNIVEAVGFIDTHVRKGALKKEILCELHAFVLKNISPDAGSFRTEMSAIFNLAGFPVYMSPPPSAISKLLNNLFTYINSEKEKFPLIAAFVSHLIFEKIHPFLDGNGRIGRLLVSTILKAKGWNFSFTVPFEEYIDTRKDAYYFHLDQGMKYTNDYLLFMLTAFATAIEEMRKQIEVELTKKELPFIPPRQEEIYSTIKDHVVVSFDMIRRRFLRIPERTLRYDLKKLVDRGLIEKTGVTKGTYYRAKNTSRDIG